MTPGSQRLDVATLARALRLPFLGASLLPYGAGALSAPAAFRADTFLLGAGCVAATHLAANLVNDYADARSGGDALDPHYYGLFGGSKLIQEGRLSAHVYLRGAVAGAVLALALAALAAWRLRQPTTLAWGAAVVALAWSYSHGPLRLVCRGLGEATVCLLFGPATFAGGWFLQTGALPDSLAGAGGLPQGLFTAAVLVANEVPDAADDARCGKRTLLVRAGAPAGWRLYLLLSMAGLAMTAAAVVGGRLHAAGLAAVAAVPAVAAAASILRRCAGRKAACLQASRMAILAQGWVGAALVLAAGLGRSGPAR